MELWQDVSDLLGSEHRELFATKFGWSLTGMGYGMLVSTIEGRWTGVLLSSDKTRIAGIFLYNIATPATLQKLKFPPKLRKAGFSSPNMDWDTIEHLCRALPSTLRELDLSHNKDLGFSSIKDKGTAFSTLEYLHTLNFRNSSLACQLSNIQLPPYLRILLLSNNLLSLHLRDVVFPKTLEVLHVDNNGLDSQDLLALVQKLPVRLRELNVSHNCIGVLAQTVYFPRRLETLDLSFNKFSPDGQDARFLRIPTTLRTLTIVGNFNTIDEVYLPRSLRTLHIDRNTLDTHTKMYLRLPPQLRTLYIRHPSSRLFQILPLPNTIAEIKDGFYPQCEIPGAKQAIAFAHSMRGNFRYAPTLEYYVTRETRECRLEFFRYFKRVNTGLEEAKNLRYANPYLYFICTQTPSLQKLIMQYWSTNVQVIDSGLPSLRVSAQEYRLYKRHRQLNNKQFTGPRKKCKS